jgi:hypothetical protein
MYPECENYFHSNNNSKSRCLLVYKKNTCYIYSRDQSHGHLCLRVYYCQHLCSCKLNILADTPPFTQSCDFRTIMPIKPRSEKVLDRGRSASKSSNLANFGLHYDCTTMFPRPTRCWHASTTMLRWPMPTSGRVYCVYTTLPLRHSSSHYDATQT